VLNGRRILYGAQNHAAVVSPVEVPADQSGSIFVHFYPEELHEGDEVADGDETIAQATCGTMLVWVDMLPTAFFTHPTIYVFITADKQIIVRDGGWWPKLNGKTVLYGNGGRYAVSFPFGLR